MSVITSLRFKAIRGRYVGATESAPKLGIDFEPDDATFIFGNQDAMLIDVEVSGNGTFGLGFNGAAGSPNTRPVVKGLRGSGNTSGLIDTALVNFVDGTIIDSKPDPFRVKFVWDPPNVVAGGQTTTTVVVPGAVLGDLVFVAPGVDLAALVASAYITNTNNVTIILSNPSASPQNLASSTWTVWVEKR
jgi:hypothetical protein